MVVNASGVELDGQRVTIIAHGADGRGIDENQCHVISWLIV